MSDAHLEVVRPESPLFRIGRAPDPWAWPDWSHATPDGTFGNRWDDPSGIYRVLYAATQRLGAFLEVLARFRPDPAVVAGLAAIAGDADALAPGVLPASWPSSRLVGRANVRGVFVHVGRSGSLAHLKRALAGRLVHYGLPDLDAATIRSTAPRRLTQEISRYVFETASGATAVVPCCGIRYASRVGDEFEAWAIFERGSGSRREGDIEPLDTQSIAAADPDLTTALSLHHLRLAD